MGHDDRFDDLDRQPRRASTARGWSTSGLELGLFAARPRGRRERHHPDELASATGTDPRRSTPGRGRPTPTTSSTLEDGRLDRSTSDVAAILLDDERADYLGGQFVHASVASMDWGGMVDFFRTGDADRATGPTATGPRSSA